MVKKSLKEHRISSHLFQQELADRSRVSLRTIQRIEKNASVGSPYVIRSLCEALNIEADTLALEKPLPEQQGSTLEDQGAKEAYVIIQETPLKKATALPYIKYINFGALCVLLLPFCNLVTVPVLYVVFKKKLLLPEERVAALKIISFQVLWSVCTVILMILTPLIQHWFLPTGDLLEIPLFIWVYLTLVFFHLIVTLMTAARLNNETDSTPRFANFF